jgi:hypothetical protein
MSRAISQFGTAAAGLVPFSIQVRMPGRLQWLAGLTARRAIFAALTSATVLALAAALAVVLAADGFSMLDAFLVAALMIEVTWTAHNA